MSEASHGHDTGRAVAAPLRAGGQRKERGELGASGGRAVGGQGALPTETGVRGQPRREPWVAGAPGAAGGGLRCSGSWRGTGRQGQPWRPGTAAARTRPSRPSVSATAYGLRVRGRAVGAGEAVSLMSRGGHLCVAVSRQGVPTRRVP